MGNERRSTTARVTQILDFFEDRDAERPVTLTKVMKELDIGIGQWNQAKDWIELIIKVQARPKLERNFIPSANNKAFTTVYHMEKE